MKLGYVYHDGGRSNYFKAGNVGDCVIRALAIIKGMNYKEVYDTVKSIVGESPRNGVPRKKLQNVMKHFGGVWVPLSGIGTGCKAHLAAYEIPMSGKIICNVSKHVTAVIDGVNYDTYDSSRNGTRCVYGYWKF